MPSIDKSCKQNISSLKGSTCYRKTSKLRLCQVSLSAQAGLPKLSADWLPSTTFISRLCGAMSLAFLGLTVRAKQPLFVCYLVSFVQLLDGLLFSVWIQPIKCPRFFHVSAPSLKLRCSTPISQA